jgi:hypothetical protein
VSSGIPPATPDGADASVGIAVEIDGEGRWDALLALSELLIPFHSFLVQHTAEPWVVHVRAPGSHGEPLARALSAIAEWQAEQRLDASVRVAGRPIGAR